MIITIDGPAGSGKSTIARHLASKYNFFYFPTSWLYRAVGLLAVRFAQKKGQEVNWQELDLEVEQMISRLQLKWMDKKMQVFLGCENLTNLLHEEVVAQYASKISENPRVRDLLLEVQRAVAKQGSLVVEGRDVGSVVFPEARVKLFITALPKIRAERMLNDATRWKGLTPSKDELLQAVLERDKRDSERSVAPLTIPQGAHVIDTSELTQSEVFEQIYPIIDAEK